VQEHPRGVFPGCFPSVTACIYHYVGPRRLRVINSQGQESQIDPFLLVRGTVQMHVTELSRPGRGKLLIHSTDLVAGCVSLNKGRYVKNRGRTVSGPAVLLPRVGTPSRSKICVLAERREVLLSDCVIAIPCESLVAARALVRSIHERWLQFRRLYGGTCARYTSLTKLAGFLRRVSPEGFVDGAHGVRRGRIRRVRYVRGPLSRAG
jgi:hypothetical protein